MGLEPGLASVCLPGGFSQGSRLFLSVPTGPHLFPSPAQAHPFPGLSLNPAVGHAPLHLDLPGSHWVIAG